MALLVGCYSPTFPEHQPCSETAQCPRGLTCDVAVNECVSELPPIARFAQISTNGNNTCAIDPAGALYCWGQNSDGELGLGDVDRRLEPARVGFDSDSDWLEVRVGRTQACGLRSTDQLWCWGDSLDAVGTPVLNPQQIPGAYKSISVGDQTWCAITSDGQLTCVSRGSPPTVQPLPAEILPVQVAVTHDTVCLIDDARRLWCFGYNGSGQLGTNDLADLPANTPHQIAGEWQDVQLGDSAACAIASTGRLSCWGTCGNGQLGRFSNCLIPSVVGDKQYLQVSVGLLQICAVDVDHRVSCMGENGAGELGAQGGLPSSELLEVELGEWQQVSTGTRVTCGIRGDDEAWCWGDNQFGQLGDGGGGDELEPVAIDPGPFDKVFTGVANGCALRAGTLWCWGANGFGQLGDGSVVERRRPLQIGTDQDWHAISIGRTHACGIRDDGTLWCWGNNRERQLGIGGNLDSRVPVQVGTETGWTEVAVTEGNTCAILDGFVSCWGRNRTSMPVMELDRPVRSLSAFGGVFLVIDPAAGQSVAFGVTFVETPEETQPWTTVERGGNHSCGLIGTELWCYGLNFEGQLGLPVDSSYHNAAPEATDGAWLASSVGSSTTCAIATDQTLWCTGFSGLNGLGKLISTDLMTPVGTKTWSAIDVGAVTTCGLQQDGSLHCWGAGIASGRGDGKGGHERPTRVAPP